MKNEKPKYTQVKKMSLDSLYLERHIDKAEERIIGMRNSLEQYAQRKNASEAYIAKMNPILYDLYRLTQVAREYIVFEEINRQRSHLN